MKPGKLEQFKGSLKGYAGLVRNTVFLLFKYRNFKSSFNSIHALLIQLYCDVIGILPLSPEVKCNICGWSGRTFYPERAMGNAGRRVVCPVCESFPRQRFLAYNLNNLRKRIGSDVRILHVAPEKILRDMVISTLGPKYTSIDIDLKRNPLVVCDLTELSFNSNAFDIVLCFAVLEHIKDDRAAIAEIYRVLRKDGLALITVPQDLKRDKTLERESPDPLNYDHFRIYGKDFRERLEEKGFAVRVSASSNLSEMETAKQLGLEEVLIYYAQKIDATAPRLRLHG